MSVTVALPVRNEADRYLPEVLAAASRWADRLVVVDDCSTDGSPDLAAAAGAEVFHTAEPCFHREWVLRSLLWEKATTPAPDWVVLLDADEILDPPAERWMPAVCPHDAPTRWLALPLFDLWDDRRHYRDDALWTAHRRLWTVAVRYDPAKSYAYRHADHHVGRWPANALEGVEQAGVSLRGGRVLHLGWIRPQDRQAKYERYMRIDPDGRWGSLAQYRSILDPLPNLAEIDAARAS